jgi:hypothetical protein
LVVLAATLGCLAMAPAAQAADVGVVWGASTWWQSQADTDREASLLAGAHAQWVRADVGWAALEPDQKGQISSYAFNLYDHSIDKANAAGIKVLMPIVEVPYWASADPNKYIDSSGKKHWNNNYRPTNWSDYGDIVKTVVNHYKAKGVHTYEIWNEPNNSRFWPSGVSASEYTNMLKAGYNAVKAADSSATVVSGGLMYNDYDYIADMYRAGAKSYMDAVAVHPYAVRPYPYFVSPTDSWKRSDGRIDPHAFPAITEVKKTMDSFGDSGKQVWLTEIGSATTTRAGGVSEATQAEDLQSAMTYVQQFPWVKASFWYALRDLNASDGGTEDRFGLVRRDFSEKPSYKALQTFISSLNTTIVSGPKKTPRRRATFKSVASPVSAGFQCRVDSSSYRSCLSLYTTRRLKKGRHVFKVRARDLATGTVDPTPARRIFRVV